MDKLIIGCGYLGRRVAALWLRGGARVLGTTRQGDHALALRSEGIEPVVCDVLDPLPLREVRGIDTVLYAVGFDRSSGASMRSVYVEGLARVLEVLPPPRRFIYISSSSVYGQTDGSWVDETSPTEPQEASGQIVLDAEKVLRAKLPAAVILRFAGIYGPGRLLRQKTIQAGEAIVGAADKWLNLIHVEDGARAVLAAEEWAGPGLLANVCDDLPIRRRDFYAELARVLGAPPPVFVDPAPDQPAPPHEKAHRRLRNLRLKEVLGFSCTYPTYREGLTAS